MKSVLKEAQGNETKEMTLRYRDESFIRFCFVIYVFQFRVLWLFCFLLFFFLTFCFYFVFCFVCVGFFCISVLAFSGVFLFPTRVFLFWGLGFRFSLRVSVLSLLLSAFEFCGLSISCSIEYTRRRFAARSPRAIGRLVKRTVSTGAKIHEILCKLRMSMQEWAEYVQVLSFICCSK